MKDFKQFFEEEQKENVFSVLEEKLTSIKSVIDKINKRAPKLKMAPLQLVELGKEVKKIRIPDEIDPFGTREVDAVFIKLRIDGDVPKINGWKFIARVMHVSEDTGVKLDQNIVKAVPGEKVPEKYRTAKPECDHCRSNRNRNDTFILQNEQGEYKQVGRNCLADFLRSSDPMDYVRLTDEMGQLRSMLEEDDSNWFKGGGRVAEQIKAEDFVATAAATIRTYGWVPRSKAAPGTIPTADLMWEYFFGRGKEADKLRSEIKAKSRPNDQEVAKKAVEWAVELKNGKDVSDYFWNLSAAASMPTVTRSVAGIMASLYSAYERNILSKEAAPAQQKEIPYQVGQRIEVDVTILKKRQFDTQYGVSILHTMQDVNGILFKWFASNEDIDTGSKVRLKGTVDSIAPDKYENNVNVVKLTRCKVIHVLVSKDEAIPEDQLAREEQLISELRPVLPSWFDMGRDAERYSLEQLLANKIIASIPKENQENFEVMSDMILRDMLMDMKRYESPAEQFLALANNPKLMSLRGETYPDLISSPHDQGVMDYVRKTAMELKQFVDKYKPIYDEVIRIEKYKNKYQGRKIKAESFSNYFQRRKFI